MKTKFSAVAIVLFLATFLAAAQGLVPAEDFARRPKLDRISFSPDGKKFAALEEVKGRMNLIVGDFSGGAIRQITSYESNDVTNYRWISDKRLVFSLIDLKGGLATQRGGGLFAVDADGRDGRALSQTIQKCINDVSFTCRQTSFFQRVRGSQDEIIAVSNERVEDSPDLVRLDTRTGKRTVLTADNPGNVGTWVMDRDLIARAAVSNDGKLQESVLWYRDSGTTPWRKIASFKFGEPHFEPLTFDADGTLYVASNLASGDKMALYKFDPSKNLPGEQLASHPDVDLRESPIVDFDSGQLIGLPIDADKPSTVWFEPTRARLQKTIDTALPGAVNRIRLLPDKKAFINSSSGSDPGTYYIFDEDKRSLREVARPRSWIKPEQMGRVEPIRYRARDGMEIPAYLTLPAGKANKNLPLVVWVHGGPWARDEYRWDPDVQFLASRGYAVLQPNYRGSTGFGRKHFNASFKQLGQSMQDDVTDGVRKLIADGTADPSRVCIGGGSYGGYATMMGLVREPSMFKCGINVVGVVDLKWWIDLGYTDFNSFDALSATAFLTRTVGDPSADAAMMEANSPRLHADKIKAPVLIVHGAGDRRVPIAHAEAMRDALKSLGKPYEWLVFPDEGHGFMREDNRATFYRRVEVFLARHLGP